MGKRQQRRKESIFKDECKSEKCMQKPRKPYCTKPYKKKKTSC